MQHSPLVSIVIPTYNNAPIVCQAIDCSLHQTYENVEVIVVDDGSTDGTEGLLRTTYKDRIIYIRQKNRGTGSARNAGIRNSSGRYLQFLDADDLLDPDKISIQIRELQRFSVKALSYCDYTCCDIDDMTVTLERMSPVFKTSEPLNDLILKWETELSIPVHCFLFDAALFKETGIFFDESLQANEDWECWMNVFALSPKVVFINSVLAYYRVRKDSRCRNRVMMRKSLLTAIDKQIKKNRSNKDVVEKLNIRISQVKDRYNDVAPLNRMFERYPVFKKVFSHVVPWRIQQRIKKQFG
jgi:glycosyltransferase involved in cell wall biosynthesis